MARCSRKADAVRKPRNRVIISGVTVADRIRAAAAELAAEPVEDEETSPEAPAEKELELGVDLFVMPDGTYMLKSDILAAENRGSVGLELGNGERSPVLKHRHLYRNMLSAALALNGPTPCKDDPRFIAERLSRDEEREMRNICFDSCPIRSACGIYASTAKPEAGFWAGRNYNQRTHAEWRAASLPRGETP